MEDCVHLLCESLGVRQDDEVSVENVCVLYQKVFLIPTTIDDTQRAMSQISTQNGGGSCSGGQILHVLLVMERERERTEGLYWDLKMLKSGTVSTSVGVTTQHLLHNSSCEHHNKRNPEHWNVTGIVEKAQRLHTRLCLGGVWVVLPSLSPSRGAARRLGWMSPTRSDLLLLLQYKYDVIKERLYKEMLQDEYGAGWWASLSSREQNECVWDLAQAAEQAFRRMDLLQMCKLPGAFRCYRSGDHVVLQACAGTLKPGDQAWSSKPRDQAWSSKPRDQAWSAVIFLSELESHYQEERDSLTVLLSRVDRAVLTQMYLSMCVALRRAERETHSYIALLASKQQWDKWPYTRGSVSQDLCKLWLQEKRDHPKSIGQEPRTVSSIQQAVLQCLVLCQEQERQSLLDILDTLSLDELQGRSHEYEASETGAAGLRQGCVSSLRQLKVSLQAGPEVRAGAAGLPTATSWTDCAIHLLSQLTLAHEEEAWTLLRTYPSTDANALTALLQQYESELGFPKLHNLQELLQAHTPPLPPRDRASVNTPTLMDGRRMEWDVGQDAENQELCVGCGGVLVPEEAPYLEILGGRGHRDEEDVERSEGGEGERRGEGKDKRQGSCETSREADGRELGSEETMEGARERSTAPEDREEPASVEKQGSLITLAWSKPADGVCKDQEMATALPKEERAEETPADLLTSTQQVCAGAACKQAEGSTYPECSQEEHMIMQCLQDQSTFSTCVQAESVANGNITSTPTPEKKARTAGRTSPNKAESVTTLCEEQKSKVLCGGEVCDNPKTDLECGGEVFEEQNTELVWGGEVCEEKSELVWGGEVCQEKSELVWGGEVCEEQKCELACQGEMFQQKSVLVWEGEVCEEKSELVWGGEVCEEKTELVWGGEVCEKSELVWGGEVCEEKSELVWGGEVCEQKSELVWGGEVCAEEQKSELVWGGEVCEEKSELVWGGEVCEEKSELVWGGEVCEQKSELVWGGEVCEKSELVWGGEVCEKSELVWGGEVCEEKSELVWGGEVCEEKSELVWEGEVCEEKSELVWGGEVCEEKSELVWGGEVCAEEQLQREATMRSLVHIQRRAERRWQQDRDRQLYRVQERLSIIQNRKSDEDLLGLTQEDTFRHLTSTLEQEDEQQQKTLVREKLQQLRRERSYILQSRRERNTTGFKELLAPTTQHVTKTEDGV